MFLFKKEKEVVDLIMKHLDMVGECLKDGIKTVEFYLRDNISEAKIWARKTRSAESEADIIRYGIRDKLYSGHRFRVKPASHSGAFRPPFGTKRGAFLTY